MILLNPGPVTLSPAVRQALLREDLCHREPEFAALTLRILRALEAVYGAAGYAAVLLTASGTGAVEAMLATFADPARATVVAANGVYGERMADMLRRQGKPHALVAGAWEQPVDVGAVAAALDAHPGAAAVAVVHHETTTGRLNDLAPLAGLCRERGVGLLVDTVSSFGGEAIDFAGWQPLAVAATANKCLHGVPGAAFVLARRERLAATNAWSPALYLDLERYHAAQRDGFSPFTQSVQACYALDAALDALQAEGGWAARRALYARRSAAVAAVLEARGVEPLLPAADSAAMLRAWRLPGGLAYGTLHAACKQAGFTIYAGQGRLAAGVFRIATMGEIPEPDLQRLTALLDGVFA